MKSRLDSELVRRGLVKSRTLAQRLIEEGRVQLNSQIVKDNSLQVSGTDKLEIDPKSPSLKFVSRGGLKLEGALAHTGWSVIEHSCLDVGISTGGFTDCLFQKGAASVTGIDVGHGQLCETLLGQKSLAHFEGVNIREVEPDFFKEKEIKTPFETIVVDVSFISLSLVLPVLKPLLAREGRVLALVKPQFELDRSSLDKNGVVKDPENYKKVEDETRNLCQKLGYKVIDYFPSSIEGTDGNKEFFVFLSL